MANNAATKCFTNKSLLFFPYAAASPPLPNTVAGAVAAAHGSWARARAMGLVVGVAAYNLSAAFDTIDRSIILRKLSSLGIRGKTNAWFDSYLDGRSQMVEYGDALSPCLPMRYGVPQGSILGPTIFLCAVHDLPDILNDNMGIAGYADDTTVWSAAQTVEEVRKNLEAASSSIVSFMASNKLAINESKTQLYYPGLAPSSATQISVGKAIVAPRSEIEFLGVKFNHRMEITPSIKSSTVAIKGITGLLRRLSLVLPKPQLRAVGRALIGGRAGYCCGLIPPRIDTTDPINGHVLALQRAINQAARAMAGKKLGDGHSVDSLLAETALPSMNRMVARTIMVEGWKALNSADGEGGGRNPLGLLLAPAEVGEGEQRRTRSATAGLLSAPTRVRSNTFVWWASCLLNKYPEVRKCATLAAVKKLAESISKTLPL